VSAIAGSAKQPNNNQASEVLLNDMGIPI